MTRSCNNKRRAAYSSLLGAASAGVSMLASCAIHPTAVSPEMACSHSTSIVTAHGTPANASMNMQTATHQHLHLHDKRRKSSTVATTHQQCDYSISKSNNGNDDEIITTTTYDDLFDYRGEHHNHNLISDAGHYTSNTNNGQHDMNNNNNDDYKYEDDNFIMKTKHHSISISNITNNCNNTTNTTNNVPNNNKTIIYNINNDSIKIKTSDINNNSNKENSSSNNNKQDCCHVSQATGGCLASENSNIKQQQQKSPFRRALFGGRQHRLFSDYTNELAVHAANDAAYDLIPENGFKIVVLGAGKVGKTSIIQRFLYQRFDAKHKPTVEDNFFVEFPYNKYTIKINIIDTSGTYQFPAMRRLAINSGDAFILVYAVDDPESFDELRRIRDMILDERHKAVEESSAQAGAAAVPAVSTPSGASSCSSGSSSSTNFRPPAMAMNSRLSLDASLVTCPACLRAGKLNPSNSANTNNTNNANNADHSSDNIAGQAPIKENENNYVVTSLEHGFSVCPQGHLISNARLSLPLAMCAELVASATITASQAQTTNTTSTANVCASATTTTTNRHRMSCTSSTASVTNHQQQQQQQQVNSTICSNDNTSRRSSTVTAAEAALRTRRTLRPPMVVVANKCDLPLSEHRVNRDQIEPMVALDWGNGFVAASAAHDIDINDIFQQVLRQAKQPPALADAIVSKRRRSLPPVLPTPHHTGTTQHASNYNLHSNEPPVASNSGRRRRHLSDTNELAEMVVTRHRPASRSGATVGGIAEHRTACHVGLVQHLLRGIKLLSKHNNKE